MAKLEGEVFLLGHWKNFESLEESLSLNELYQVLESMREKDHSDKKFMAALKGIDLDENKEQDEAFEEVKRRAQAKLTGRSEQELQLGELGIEIIEEE